MPMLRYMEDRKANQDSQPSFTRGKCFLSNLVAFHDEVIMSVDKGWPTDVIYLDFYKAFDTVSYKILLAR